MKLPGGRKFWLALVAELYAIFALIAPEVAVKVPQETILAAAAIVISFIVMEGKADIVSRKNGK